MENEQLIIENEGKICILLAMEKENPIRDKSYAFAVHIVEFCRYLQDKKEFVLSKQLLKSGTSVGANVEEALQAQSKADFISKLSISLKEAFESRFWLRLMLDTQTASVEKILPLQSEIQEIVALLTSIVKSSRQNLDLEP